MTTEKFVSFFCDILKTNKRMHYSDLVKRLQCSDVDDKKFFDSYSDFRSTLFFLAHPSEFVIGGDGFVSLADPADATHSRIIEDTEIHITNGKGFIHDKPNSLISFNCSATATVVEELVFTLWKYGSMHYIALIECAKKNKKKSKVDKHFKPLGSSEQLMFFENHRDTFAIKSNGYLTPSDSVLERYRKLNEQEAEVVEYFSSVLEQHGEMSSLKLVECLQSSDLYSKNFFDFFSNREIREFFKTHWSRFAMTNIGGLCKVKGKKTQREKGNSESIESNVVYRTAELQNLEFCEVNYKSPVKEASVELLVSTLRQYGSMHYLAVVKCVRFKPNSGCLTKLSSTEKLAIFKYHSNFFTVTNDGYVVPTSFIQERYRVREAEIVNFFVSVLKTTPTIHYKELMKLLQNSDLEAKDHFYYFSKFQIREFFESDHKFILGKDFLVSLHGDAEINSTNEYDESITLTVESGTALSKLENNTYNITQRFAIPISSTCSNSKNAVGETIFGTVNKGIPKAEEHSVTCSSADKYSVESDTACFTITQKSISTETIRIKKEPLELAMTDGHMQSVRYLVLLLKKKKHAYYHELLHKACNYDRYISEFFSHFTMEHVLEFIQMHSMYFSVQEGGIVTLVDPTITLTKVFSSKDHVCQITSTMEDKAVQFFVNLLCQRKQVALTELECHTGFSAGYVISFFVANYYGEKFSKFFQQHSDIFHIRADGFVELSSKLSRIDVCSTSQLTVLDKMEEETRLVPNPLKCQNKNNTCYNNRGSNQLDSFGGVKEQCKPEKPS